MSAVSFPVGNGQYATVDADDWGRVRDDHWSCFLSRGIWYVSTRTPDGQMYLHRKLLDASAGQEVDHRDGDGLNNCRTNLRLATHQQNLCNQRLSRANTSGYKGVHRCRRRWCAMIKVFQKTINLGAFDDPACAARAYDRAAQKHFGEFARTNADLGLVSPENRLRDPLSRKQGDER